MPVQDTPLGERIGAAVSSLLAVAFWLAVAGWVGYVFYSPHQRSGTTDLAAFQKPRNAVDIALYSWLDLYAEIRVEPRGANNVEVFLAKTEFESVPFPDRGAFVAEVAAAWCENTVLDSHLFLPSVKFRDIRTGDILASYNCVLSSIWPKAGIQRGDVELHDFRMTVTPDSEEQILTGRIMNKSARESLKTLVLEITIQDCFGNQCTVVAETSHKVETEIAPGTSAELGETIRFTSPLPRSTQGRRIWSSGILFAGSH